MLFYHFYYFPLLLLWSCQTYLSGKCQANQKFHYCCTALNTVKYNHAGMMKSFVICITSLVHQTLLQHINIGAKFIWNSTLKQRVRIYICITFVMQWCNVVIMQPLQRTNTMSTWDCSHHRSKVGQSTKQHLAYFITGWENNVMVLQSCNEICWNV